MEPTGPHEAVAGSIAGRIYVEIFRDNFNWLVPKTCLIKPLYAEATALRPDVVVLDKVELREKPLWQKEPVICNGNTIKGSPKEERVREWKCCDSNVVCLYVYCSAYLSELSV